MPNAMPASVIADLRFIGLESASVKSLSGFNKKRHTLPDSANATTNAFLARLCAPELAERGEALFQAVREAMGYKRREVSLSIDADGGLARLSARDFSLELFYELEPSSPEFYLFRQTLLDAKTSELLHNAAFNEVFAGTFSELSFTLQKGVQVEAVIDAVEGLDEVGNAAHSPLRVTYPSDCSVCEIAVAGVEARVRCTGASIDMIFPRAGSPLELLQEFAAVRSAFSLSELLRGLVE
ncbi:hypothetical protein AXK12_03045 [Cephaloticoccus capnophilus]|uniref:Uncharacterized protein n=1 Tax=Cephaloticoccus capnophilus TaxID=1548208 RepID=A0A139SQ66_9BACT|nr:hypothetical protein [Cephaloticoccus capnophilus]KXU36745.1 hypothetical protein AXK12_03045 [Cephaloticoccus capnophilus]